MKIKKLLLCLSLVALFLIVLTACNNTDTSSNTESSISTETRTETSTNTNTAQECEHELEFVKGTAPTCTKDGVPDYQACKKCDLCIAPDIVLPALGHTREIIPAVMPTCTENGTTMGAKCTTCGETLVEPSVLNALGHVEKILKAVAKTCTTNGVTEGKICTICNAVLIEQEVLVATGHNDVNGYCSICNESLWAPEPTDEELSIIKDGASDFIIVYESYNDGLKSFAEQLASHIFKTYNVSLPVYDYFEKPSDAHEIVLGMANENAKYAKRKIATTNDFIFDVCGNDLLVYAPNKYLYAFMLEAIKLELFTGEKDSLTISADTCFTYQESKYKDYSFAEYLKTYFGKEEN